jgi:hypothetical protein
MTRWPTSIKHGGPRAFSRFPCMSSTETCQGFPYRSGWVIPVGSSERPCTGAKVNYRRASNYQSTACLILSRCPETSTS